MGSNPTPGTALADAVRDGPVERNAAALVSPPRAERPEMTVWTVGELKQFLQSVEGHLLYAAFVVLATTGMRRGELLGLQRLDVDLARAELSVRRTVWPVEPGVVLFAFERLVAGAGVPRIQVHDLRHTYATIALRAGC